MKRRTFLQIGLVGGGAVLSGGLGFQEMPAQWAPDHVESDDPSWRLLSGAQWSIDEARGLMTANFTDLIRRMDGHDLTISGFLMPLDARRRFTHFVLTRRNSSCPFCPPNEPTDAIEVFGTQNLEFTADPYVVSGRFQIVSESSDGLFYRLSAASVRAGP